ncbi:MAG: hypothetical protein U0572_11370 [Phycisphaerales bacterium]
MSSIPRDLEQRLLDFACGNLSPAEFENTVCADPRLEPALLLDEFLDLLQPNLGDPAGVKEARSVAARILKARDEDGFARYQAEVLLDGMLRGTTPLLEGLRGVARLYYEGLGFVPGWIVGLEDETETVPLPHQYSLYSEAGLKEALQPLEWYREQILDAARELLADLRRQRGAA